MTERLRLGSLPSVTSSHARASRVPWLWTCGPRASATVVLTGIGQVRLSWEGFEEPGSTSQEELVLVGSDGRRGRVAVDRWFALTIVAMTLGSRAPRVIRGLGRVEKGILAGHVAAVLAQRGCQIAVSLDEPRFLHDPRFVSLALRAETDATAGRIRLDLPPEWLVPRDGSGSLTRSSAWSSALSSDLGQALREAIGHLPLVLSVELASTEIGARDWAETRPGDAVLFTGHPFLTSSEWPVSLRLGDHAADATANKNGAVCFVGPLAPVPSRAMVAGSKVGIATRERITDESVTMTVASDDQTLNAISAAPIEIVAELGRLTLRGEEVLGLQRGSVLALGHQGQTVTLMVGGRPWARGELVNVDGELGVRITELTRG